MARKLTIHAESLLQAFLEAFSGEETSTSSRMVDYPPENQEDDEEEKDTQNATADTLPSSGGFRQLGSQKPSQAQEILSLTQRVSQRYDPNINPLRLTDHVGRYH